MSPHPSACPSFSPSNDGTQQKSSRNTTEAHQKLHEQQQSSTNKQQNTASKQQHKYQKSIYRGGDVSPCPSTHPTRGDILIDPHRPFIDLHRPFIDLSSIIHRPFIDLSSTFHRPFRRGVWGPGHNKIQAVMRISNASIDVH